VTRSRAFKVLVGIALIVFPLAAEQQLTREDYARAEQYLIGNIGKLVFKTQVVPRFIGKSDRFWYKLNAREGRNSFSSTRSSTRNSRLSIRPGWPRPCRTHRAKPMNPTTCL